MAFHEVRFPDNISRGARGGSERDTQIVELSSGDEECNASWANSRRRHDVAYGIRRSDDLSAVVDQPRLPRFKAYTTGATTTGVTKTVRLGTGGASGSTTVVNIGSATAGAGGTTVVNTPPMRCLHASTMRAMRNVWPKRVACCPHPRPSKPCASWSRTTRT